jgi:uncharacterized protein
LTVERLQILRGLSNIDAGEWNKLAGDQPFLRHEFLYNLERSGCATKETGWDPHHLTLWRSGSLVGAMPLYLKHHSYGEYIFDWAWADAYHRNGLNYYPKLLSAIPFTPVTGARLLTEEACLRVRLAEDALELARELKASSVHILYPTESQAAELGSGNYLQRNSTQFHWHNHGYCNFDDFLSAMSHDKRKKIKQERRKLNDQGIRFEQVDGVEISEADWRFFNHCYRTTYRQHHSSPYLNLDFFLSLGRDLPNQLVMFKAIANDKPIAAALNLKCSGRLFGRYWGADVYVPGLHFETCYYQGIAYCIERGIGVFEGGVQGEHKLARGFMPVKTYSNHWLAHSQFSTAIGDYLARESAGVQRYMEELTDMTPFKNTP